MEKMQELLKCKGYELRDKIGKGSYSTCYTLWNTLYKQHFVCKVIDIPDGANKESKMRSFRLETETLIQVVHPNIIKIYDFFMDDENLYLILEYCSGGTLEQMMKEQGTIPMPLLHEYVSQLISALSCCHAAGIAHNDLKPSNIFIDSYGRIKLADFGLAQFANGLSNRFLGSLGYMPPEILLKKSYDPYKADIWSLGVTVYQLATGHIPWTAHSIVQFSQRVTSGIYIIDAHVSPEIEKLIKLSLEIDPQKRASLSSLMSLEIGKLSRLNRSKKSVLSSSISSRKLNSVKSYNTSVLKSMPSILPALKPA